MLGENIKKYRKGKMTQKALAEKIGVTAATVTKYEKNNIEPSIDMLGKIAEALGVTINDLLLDENKNDITIVQNSENLLKYSKRNLSLEAFKILLGDNASILNENIDKITIEQLDQLRKNIADYIEFQLNKLGNNKSNK